MTTNTRRLHGVLLALAATAGPVAAQSGPSKYPPPPGRYAEPPPTSAPQVVPQAAPGSGFAMPFGRPPAAAAPNPVERLTVPVRQAGVEEMPDPVGTLTGQPLQPQPQTGGLSPGSYPSPYFTDGPGCAGPLGRNGRVGYEIYVYTGATWAVGEGRLARQLYMGWMSGGGGKSLFFNPTHDAAWVVDLGLSNQYNRGSPNHFTPLELRRVPLQVSNGSGGTISVPQADIIAPLAVRALTRTNFNFALGRDWWYWGPGTVGQESGWNLRIGGLVGGRWGTAHIDEVPQSAANGTYARRQGVSHGFFLASNATVEVPMGTYILFAGLRTEWGYDWMNLFAPLEGNLHNFNVLMTCGVRF